MPSGTTTREDEEELEPEHEADPEAEGLQELRESGVSQADRREGDRGQIRKKQANNLRRTNRKKGGEACAMAIAEMKLKPRQITEVHRQDD